MYTRDPPNPKYKNAIQERAEVWARNAEISLATHRNCVHYTSNGALQAVFDWCFGGFLAQMPPLGLISHWGEQADQASGKEAIGYNLLPMKG